MHAFLVNVRCSAGHTWQIAYDYDLGFDFVQRQCERAYGVAPVVTRGWFGSASTPHKVGDERCSTCGDARMTYRITERRDG